MNDATFEQRQLVAAVRALERKQLVSAFDAAQPDSRPSKVQEGILRDIAHINYRYVVAGNRCLPEGTLIPTPDRGLVPIEKLEAGDMVYDQHGQPIVVEQTFDNGEADVIELLNRGIVWGESTINHTWLTCNSSDRRYKEKELTLEEFQRDTQVRRTEVNLPLGPINEPHAYIIGALLGDGCSRAAGIAISSESDAIPSHIATLLDCKLSRPKHNYTYRILGSPQINHYKEWCKGRYAHEKTCNLDIIKTWNRQSLLSFVAGVLDTDGSVYINEYDNVCVQFEMQALPVIEAIKYAMLALWQTPVTIHVNDREKYVNGPTYSLRVGTNSYSRRILKELSPFIQTERKQYKESYNNLTSKRSAHDRVGIRLGQKRRARVYDIRVASADSLYLTSTGLVTHNSGKSQLAARELTWILTDTHPYWKRPAHWKSNPITCLIAGQNLTMMESEIWYKKILPFLDASEWSTVRQGNQLKRAVNKKTGDQIIFLSHTDGSEKNRRQMQGYTAEYVWLDEMPTSPAILEELQARIATTGGRFIATFTPKFRSDIIRRIVDSAQEPYGKKYKMSMLDNPVIDQKEQLARLAGRSQAEINTALYGDWSTGDNAVYHFDYETMTVDKLPDHYNAGWRHVESVDPALRSKCGYTLWAEDPNSGTWYLVNDEYIQGDVTLDPERLFQIIQKRSANYNITRRISDSMAYYTSVASKHGVSYLIPYSKNNRKEELIKGLQTALSTGKIKIGRWCGMFIDEVQSCQFREDSDQLINSSSYHTLDCAQYFCDMIPAYDPSQAALPWQVMLQQANNRRLEMESRAQKLKQQTNNAPGTRVVKSIRGWGRPINKRGRGRGFR